MHSAMDLLGQCKYCVFILWQKYTNFLQTNAPGQLKEVTYMKNKSNYYRLIEEEEKRQNTYFSHIFYSCLYKTIKTFSSSTTMF